MSRFQSNQLPLLTLALAAAAVTAAGLIERAGSTTPGIMGWASAGAVALALHGLWIGPGAWPPRLAAWAACVWLAAAGCQRWTWRIPAVMIELAPLAASWAARPRPPAPLEQASNQPPAGDAHHSLLSLVENEKFRQQALNAFEVLATQAAVEHAAARIACERHLLSASRQLRGCAHLLAPAGREKILAACGRLFHSLIDSSERKPLV